MFTDADILQNPILKFFNFTHLPAELQRISQEFYDLAVFIHLNLEPSAEKTTCFRKILEAKDCAVRGKL